MYEINDFSPFIGRLENSELRDVRFLEVAVMFLKNYSIDNNHKTTHKKILLNLLRLVSLILPSALQSIQRCQVCAKLRLTVKVWWPIIARSIDTHAFLPHVATFVNRTCDSLEGV